LFVFLGAELSTVFNDEQNRQIDHKDSGVVDLPAVQLDDMQKYIINTEKKKEVR
jgi:hypothetical protein